jgi:hypothetical protein
VPVADDKQVAALVGVYGTTDERQTNRQSKSRRKTDTDDRTRHPDTSRGLLISDQSGLLRTAATPRGVALSELIQNDARSRVEGALNAPRRRRIPC